MKACDVVRILEERGFRLERRRGSHRQLVCRRKAPPGHRCGRGWRRRHEGNALLDQARFAWKSVPLGMGGHVGLKKESSGPPALPAKAVEPRPDQQGEAHGPGGAAGQQAAALPTRQAGYRFEIHLYGRGKRSFGLGRRCGIDGDVEINADGMPSPAAPINITPECGGHAEPSHGRWIVPKGVMRGDARACQTTVPICDMREGQGAVAASGRLSQGPCAGAVVA